METNKTKAKNKRRLGIFFLILLLYLLFSCLPAIRSAMKKHHIGDNQETYENLELQGVEAIRLSDTAKWRNGELARTVPELKDAELKDGFELYRFDVYVQNTGTGAIWYNGAVYLNSGDGEAYQFFHNKETDSKERETRIIPTGREAIVTVYGQVSEDSSTVSFTTYNTKSGNPEKMEFDLSEALWDEADEDTEIFEEDMEDLEEDMEFQEEDMEDLEEDMDI